MLHVLDGGVAGPAFDLAQIEGGAHAPLDRVRPSVDGDPHGYLVAYKEGDALAPGQYHTRVTSFALAAGGLFVVHEGHLPLGLATSSRTCASVSSDSAQVGGTIPAFEVVWDEPFGSTDRRISAATVPLSSPAIKPPRKLRKRTRLPFLQ